MTPDVLAPTRTPLGQRERSPFRVWVSLCWFNGEQVYRWACPKCGKTGGVAPFRGLIIGNANRHAQVCPALRLARLEAEIEELADGYGHANQITVANDLTNLLARHRQASE
jgi:hypothetical protein